jgi:hypothetical protein
VADRPCSFTLCALRALGGGVAELGAVALQTALSALYYRR